MRNSFVTDNSIMPKLFVSRRSVLWVLLALCTPAPSAVLRAAWSRPQALLPWRLVQAAGCVAMATGAGRGLCCRSDWSRLRSCGGWSRP